jgi:uncharacterized protein (TIGR03086 family)
VRDLVAVLAEPNRRRLLELLLGGERTVGELQSQFEVTRSAISQHLAVLADAGLVEGRKEGRFRYYRVIPQGLAALRASLDVFWANELEDLAAAGSSPNKGATMATEHSVLVALDADAVFALLTDPERLRRWQAVTARVDVRAGGEYRWTITPGHSAAGVVAEVEPGRRLVMTWGWEDADDLPPGSSTVTITLEPAEGGTLVRLVHDGLTEAQAAGHAQGWSHYLERLVTASLHGDAGPDEWAAAPDPMDRLSAAEASLAVCQLVLRGLDAADRTKPTPCAAFDVHALVDHLLGSVTQLGTMAGATVAPGSATTPESLVATAAQQTLEAWRRRGVEGSVAYGDSELPAAIASAILSIEFLVHAWDVARATSQPLPVSDALAEYVLGLAREVIAPPMRDGERFAAEVEVGPDAVAMERLVAFTGRTP